LSYGDLKIEYLGGRPPLTLLLTLNLTPQATKLQNEKELNLENVAIANALQLEASQAKPAPSRFNYDAMPSLKSLNLSIAVL